MGRTHILALAVLGSTLLSLALVTTTHAQLGALARAIGRAGAKGGSLAGKAAKVGSGAGRLGKLGASASKAGKLGGGAAIGHVALSEGRAVRLFGHVPTSSSALYVTADATGELLFVSRTGSEALDITTVVARGDDLYFDLPAALTPRELPRTSGQRFVLDRQGRPHPIRAIEEPDGTFRDVVDLVENAVDVIDLAGQAIDLTDYAVNALINDPEYPDERPIEILLVANCQEHEFASMWTRDVTRDQALETITEPQHGTRYLVISTPQGLGSLYNRYPADTTVITLDDPCAHEHAALARQLRADLDQGSRTPGYTTLASDGAEVLARDPFVITTVGEEKRAVWIIHPEVQLHEPADYLAYSGQEDEGVPWWVATLGLVTILLGVLWWRKTKR